jgi:hypothetical protein
VESNAAPPTDAGATGARARATGISLRPNSKQFAGGGNIVFLAIGPGVSANHTDSTPSNHYGLLKTLEACYGLGALNGASTGYEAATPISGICQ